MRDSQGPQSPHCRACKGPCTEASAEGSQVTGTSSVRGFATGRDTEGAAQFLRVLL